MDPSKLVPFYEKPIFDRFKSWSEDTLTLTLLGLAGLIIWIALKKDHAVLKAVLITYILLP